mmetsp:Transcript_21564/g.31483  ORF Transcript_21564/g.31483 Transcript_21564/m.31483 type:complete len:251 (-) Transcript_21564:220-972(-)|eukprot:CAMPEP_0197246952 /NCGR_PEP_ID=MMETSP1429-20130617/24429_1 /TAXON_ID=49237 /ORGANISM="Chaetoceros  sp., Strain UNC1202" /LENGTH=250 /DNA_ID=CAMNT_0042707745 /DNA_START=93 /DNA_END=845 /DNA_ORIENTATION=-
MRIGTFFSSSLILINSVCVLASNPLSVQVILRGKKYTVPNVSTVSELQSTLESQSGVAASNQGRVLFGGKKLKPNDVLDDVGVEEGSVINIVPSKGKKDGAAAGVGGMDGMMQDMMKQAGVDTDQMEEMMKQMGGEMPSMEDSMEAMQEMMNSPMFQEYMSDPEKLEQSRQMILSNPMMKGMMASMPGFDEILNDPVKWRETMVAAANMYKNLGSDLSKLMEGGDMGGFGGMPGMNMGNAALDELSEGED